jgi:peptidoglycan/xylan/chitin deacetylase (PgdA/CDA1 family)
MLNKTSLIRLGLETLYHTRAHVALEPACRGIGVIFTLHRVAAPGAASGPEFGPNGCLEISAEFLDAVIARVRDLGLDLVGIDEAQRRIVEPDGTRFAAFTIDDGYRDSLDVALPVFRRHRCPFTVYVASGLIDRTVNLWWVVLERVIAGADTIRIPLEGRVRTFACENDRDRQAAFEAIYWPLRAMGESGKLHAVRALADRHGVDIAAIDDELGLTAGGLSELARDPLVTIGAHTVDHPALSRLEAGEMEREMAAGRDRLAEILGAAPRHFAYPYGDLGSAGPREFAAAARLGFQTAVTTQKGVITRHHRRRLTALPRISINGNYQDLRLIDVLVSGVPFALSGGLGLRAAG